MSFTDRLGELVRACFTGIWIESHEHPDALASLTQLCRRENWNLAAWDVDQGLRVGGAEAAGVSAADPLAAIRAAGAIRSDGSTTLVVLVNFHRFLQSAEIVQALARQIALGKHGRYETFRSRASGVERGRSRRPSDRAFARPAGADRRRR
jgi:hypothetical protein